MVGWQNVTNLISGGGSVPGATPSVVALGVFGVVFTSFCAIGQALTPLYLHYFPEPPPAVPRPPAAAPASSPGCTTCGPSALLPRAPKVPCRSSGSNPACKACAFPPPPAVPALRRGCSNPTSAERRQHSMRHLGLFLASAVALGLAPYGLRRPNHAPATARGHDRARPGRRPPPAVRGAEGGR